VLRRVAHVLYVGKRGVAARARAAATARLAAIVEKRRVAGDQVVTRVQPAAVAVGNDRVVSKIGAQNRGAERRPRAATVAAPRRIAKNLGARQRKGTIAVKPASARSRIADKASAIHRRSMVSCIADIRTASVVAGAVGEEIERGQG